MIIFEIVLPTIAALCMFLLLIDRARQLISR